MNEKSERKWTAVALASIFYSSAHCLALLKIGSEPEFNVLELEKNKRFRFGSRSFSRIVSFYRWDENEGAKDNCITTERALEDVQITHTSSDDGLLNDIFSF